MKMEFILVNWAKKNMSNHSRTFGRAIQKKNEKLKNENQNLIVQRFEIDHLNAMKVQPSGYMRVCIVGRLRR